MGIMARPAATRLAQAAAGYPGRARPRDAHWVHPAYMFPLLVVGSCCCGHIKTSACITHREAHLEGSEYTYPVVGLRPSQQGRPVFFKESKNFLSESLFASFSSEKEVPA